MTTMPERSTRRVNSYNEWDPLEEVIMGSIDGAMFPSWDVVEKVTVPPGAWESIEEIVGKKGEPYSKELMAAGQKCLAEFIHILEAEGVTVRRPDAMRHQAPYATPAWEVRNGFSAANPRDVFLVIGDELIEAPMTDRGRYFEAWPYRSLLKEYFKAGARWTAAPKPQLLDAQFNWDYRTPGPDEEMRYIITEFEPTFDAADFVRCGRDLFVQKSHVTNSFGIEWLERHLGAEYHIHPVETRYKQAMHIDTTLMPLAPGKVLVNPEFLDPRKLPRIFHTWDILIAPEAVFTPKNRQGVISKWGSMNVLMLDESRVVVEKSQEPTIQALRNWGFKPIPCSFEDYYVFGGSFHCSTLDVRRRGGLQSYFDIDPPAGPQRLQDISGGAMPDIAGFRALTYDPSRVELSQVVTPPYDVIDGSQRAALAQRHPYNFVQIDLPGPDRDGDRYGAAARRLGLWRGAGVLRQEAVPALYRYHQVFHDPESGGSITRKGAIAAVALSPWSAGMIRPHETTLTAPREDRARLLDATRVHLSPVFAMYDDDSGAVEQMIDPGRAAPDLTAITDDGTCHRVWRVTALDVLDAVSRFMNDRRAYMLDGHHRYETMVAFRDRENGRARSHAPNSDMIQCGLMFLVPMSDPGLLVLPTHRVIQGIPGTGRDTFLAGAQRHCRVRRLADAARDAATLRSALRDAPDVPTCVVVFPSDRDGYLLSVETPGSTSRVESEIAVLHEVILERVLGLSTAAGQGEPRVRYLSNTQTVLDEIAAGAGHLALILRPPRVAQIKQLADRGRIMPQKSTYFFPKLASGLVMMPVEPAELAGDQLAG